jgi:hypothetical protein
MVWGTTKQKNRKTVTLEGENESIFVVPILSGEEYDVTIQSSEDTPLFDPVTGAILFSPFQQDGRIVRVVVKHRKKK